MDAFSQLCSSFIDGKSDDKNLELRLGPPVGNGSVYFLNSNIHGAKRLYQATLEDDVGIEECLPNMVKLKHKHPCQNLSPRKRDDENVFWSLRGSSSFQSEVRGVKPGASEAYDQQEPQFMAKKSPQDMNSYGVGLQNMKGNAFSCPADVSKSSPKRAPPAPVVGWPPVRSYRKNLTSTTTSKQSPMSPGQIKEEKTGGEPDHATEHMFIKVYMDGIPIGRKVNLKAYDSYEKLSMALDELFAGLLAAWRSGLSVENDGSMKEEDEDVANREYTLVYEDNEGDSILVGDVPWNMFVSTAKKLRLLKSSTYSHRPLTVTSLDEKKTFIDPAAENG